MVRGGGGGARNIRYKGPAVAAIFVMTSFNMERGEGWPWTPRPSPGCAAVPQVSFKYFAFQSFIGKC